MVAGLEVRDDDADAPGLAGREPPRRAIGAIPELPGDRKDRSSVSWRTSPGIANARETIDADTSVARARPRIEGVESPTIAAECGRSQKPVKRL